MDTQTTSNNLFQRIARSPVIGAIALIIIAAAGIGGYLYFAKVTNPANPGGGNYEQLARTHERGNDFLKYVNDGYGQLNDTDKTNDEKAWLDIAFYKSELGDKDGAIAAYNAAIEQFPSNEVMLANLAHLYDDSKNYKKAEETYKKVLAINSHNIRSIQDLADLYRFRFTGREQDIISLVQNNGLSANPDDPNLLLYMAEFYRTQMKDKNKAVEYYQKVIALVPDDKSLQIQLKNLLSQP